MTGEWRDFLIHPDGRRELVGEGKNLVVNSAYTVMALAMKQNPDAKGFLYWAVGDGNMGATAGDTTTWDTGVQAGTIKALATDIALARETFRKLIDPSNIVFVDSANVVSTVPTNRLRITVTLDFNEPAGGGKLREWGIFGGSTAALSASNPKPVSATANSGYLINRKTHKTYDKPTSVQLERQLVFTF
jgi:hypothetical protein